MGSLQSPQGWDSAPSRYTSGLSPGPLQSGSGVHCLCAHALAWAFVP